MSTYVLPGVYTNEQDFSRRVELAGQARVGLLVDSDQGPVGDSENDTALFRYSNGSSYTGDFGTPESSLELTAVNAVRAGNNQGVTADVRIKRALPRDNEQTLTNDIDSVDTTAETVTILSEEPQDHLTAGDSFEITGSTGNDGTYTVSSIDDSVTGETTITVDTSIDDSTADGQIEYDNTDFGEVLAKWAGLEAHQSGGDAPEALTTGVAYPLENYTFPDSDTIVAFFAQEPNDFSDDIDVFVDTSEGESDEFLVEVYFEDELQEEFLVSRNEKTDQAFRQLFIEDRINENSDYIYAINNDNVNGDTVPEWGSDPVALGGGTSGPNVAVADLITDAQVFRDTEQADVRFLATGGVTDLNDPQYANELMDIAASRQDCRAIVDAPKGTSAQDIVDTFTSNLTIPTSPFNAGSYASVYAPWLKDFEFTRRKQVDLPPSARFLRNAITSWQQNDPWFAVAGPRRGRVDVDDVNQVFDDGEQELLINNQVNPIVERSATGIQILTQKTYQSFESATENANVRDLLNVAKVSIAAFAQDYIQEFNDPFTRNEMRTRIQSFLSEIEGARGLENFGVKIDEENNPPEVRDAGELVGDINLVPTIPAAVIILNFNIFPSGTVDFSEALQSTN
jgi:hypothetical protein